MHRIPLALLAPLLLAFPLAAESPVGWRQDGTGRAVKAKPPLEWSQTSNVVWKTKMPGNSFASPVVVGERVFALAEPAELLCLDAKKGEIAWRRSTSYAEVFGEQKAKEIEEEHARLEKARDAASREVSKFRKEKPDDKDGLAPLEDARKKADKAVQEARQRYPKKDDRGGAGRTAATPVCDGKTVAAVFGTGIVAAYTVDGKRLWAKFVEAPKLGFGHSASPLLVGDKLVVHLEHLIALDLKTGKELWRVATGTNHASPVSTRLGKEDVVISSSGAVVRASDGKVLLKGKWSVSESTPVLEGNVLVVCRSGYEAFELSMEDGAVSMKPLWKAAGPGDRRTPSSVIHDGLLYALNTGGVLDVIDMKNGDSVYRQRLPMTQVYSSLAVAGGHVFALDTRGKAVVFEAGREYKRVATNQLEGTGANPVFVGGRMFVRGQQHLYCLGKSE